MAVKDILKLQVLNPNLPWCLFANIIIIFVSCANFGAKKQEKKKCQNPLIPFNKTKRSYGYWKQAAKGMSTPRCEHAISRIFILICVVFELLAQKNMNKKIVKTLYPF